MSRGPTAVGEYRRIDARPGVVGQTEEPMGRTPKTSSSDVASDDLRSEIEQVDRLMARLRRAADQVSLGFSIQTAESTLAKRYARFTPTGDLGADRATLAEFEQQATSLLRKAQKQQKDNTARRVAGTAGIYLGSR